MIEARHIELFMGGKRILKDVSVRFGPRRIHGIIGPNGSGKSSLLKTLCRIWTPSSGAVLVGGQDYRRLSRKRLSRMITLVSQNTFVTFPVPLYDMVAMGRNPHMGRFQGLSREDRRMIDAAIDTCGIRHLLGRRMTEISGGEVQLTAIARALATGASIILLDEPTSDLDIRHALDVMALMGQLRQEGKTILVSLHDLNLARRHCDTVTILEEGSIFFSGDTHAAFTPAHILQVFGVHMSTVGRGEAAMLDFKP